jgi:acetate kinase
MCTRSGTVDPGILFYLAGQGATIDELNRVLNQESGLKGLSGLPKQLTEDNQKKRDRCPDYEISLVVLPYC